MLASTTVQQSNAERLAPLRRRVDKEKILVHEIYASIQGESSFMGIPCVFVRTTGCHLRCHYCDTEQAFFSGAEIGIAEILERVHSYQIPLVELTGGEPLLQAQSFTLLDHLVEHGFTVLLETSGAVSIARVNRKVKVILDVKTPSSGEHHRHIFHNLELLWPGCEVKFVIGSREDYEYAKKICADYRLMGRTHVLFSPMVAGLAPQLLAEWIVQDQLSVRFQLQLHRVLYGEAPGK